MELWSRAAGAPPGPGALFTGKHVGEDPVAARADELVGYVVFERVRRGLRTIRRGAREPVGDLVQQREQLEQRAEAEPDQRQHYREADADAEPLDTPESTSRVGREAAASG